MGRRRSHHAPALLTLAGSIAAAVLLTHAVRRMLAPRRERRSERARADAWVPRAPADGGLDHQGEESGVGSLTHRRYSIKVPRAAFSRQTLMLEMQRRVHELAPSAFARFEKTSGDPSYMSVGDEYDVTMLGPWNGRVRVADVSDDSFTLVTLEGHPEAGHITFSVQELSLHPESFNVIIESWARARDQTVQVAYDTMTVGRHVQAEVWVTFLQRVAELTGCEEAPEVSIETEELTT